MKEHPVLFCGEMVRALLRQEHPKTQTRRIAKLNAAGRVERRGHQWHVDDPKASLACPYGQPGDRLWVRETFYNAALEGEEYIYRADWVVNQPRLKWKPSIFMPRALSRITLEITGVRLERLQKISEEDAEAEGLDMEGMIRHQGFARQAYRRLWNSINLAPMPVYGRRISVYGWRTAGQKKQVTGYVSFPWCNDDFAMEFPGPKVEGIYRGRPLTVTPNPWVWVVSFKKL